MLINGVNYDTSALEYSSRIGNHYSKMALDNMSAKANSEVSQVPSMNSSEREFYEATGINPYSNTASREKYGDWILSEKSAQSAREWTAQREDSQYQRLVKDLRASGINPWILQNSGGSPISSSTQGVNHQGSTMTSAKTTKDTNMSSIGRVLLASALLLIRSFIH